MMRLPPFQYMAPAGLDAAVALLSEAGPEATVVAGGTDLWPSMKRRQKTPRLVIGLRGVAELRVLRVSSAGEPTFLGAGLTLAALLRDPAVQGYGALSQALSVIATPHLRNMGTLGGNLCLDTRCNYYDQSHEWREAIGFCLKKGGEVCWVAPGSPRCWAVSSTDAAPAVVALGGRVVLRGRDGTRVLAAEDLYEDDGRAPLRKRPDEILTGVELPGLLPGWDSAYVKLRRREAFDFPVLSAAVSVRRDGARRDAPVIAARVVLGAAGSRPVLVPGAAEALLGRPLGDESIAEAAARAAARAKPLDNTDFALGYRKRLCQQIVAQALHRCAQ